MDQMVVVVVVAFVVVVVVVVVVAYGGGGFACGLGVVVGHLGVGLVGVVGRLVACNRIGPLGLVRNHMVGMGMGNVGIGGGGVGDVVGMVGVAYVGTRLGRRKR